MITPSCVHEYNQPLVKVFQPCKINYRYRGTFITVQNLSQVLLFLLHILLLDTDSFAKELE